MPDKIRDILIKNLSNIPGWRTARHLVVIESDDWGSIRMPSNEVFESIVKSGIDLISDPGLRFNKFDSLETAEDLASLYEVLSSVKDCTGRYAVLTPVSVVANPDFTQIEQSAFTKYFYEPFTETFKKYPGCEKSFDLWKEGIEKRLFVPQFHGREHLNVKVWMKALGIGHERTLQAFSKGFWGISTAKDPDIRIEFQAAFDYIDPEDLTYQSEVIKTGLDLFQELFGYRATFFVPPNGPFSSKLEEKCSILGIKYLSTSKIHIEPAENGRSARRRIHWLGQKNKSGLTYLTRNCFFEPSKQAENCVDNCLKDISTAFRWHKPAVISSHRVNYIGTLDRNNRESGHAHLGFLLKEILKHWPDAEFITSHELGEIISHG
jgi:hypothetical protein